MYICLIGLEQYWSRVKAIKQNSNTLLIFIYISESTQFCSNLINYLINVLKSQQSHDSETWKTFYVFYVFLTCHFKKT